MDLRALQNGSDIRGIGSEGVEGQHINLTDEAVERIGRAFVVWLSVKKNVMPDELTIGLGRDSRVSGPRIRDALVRAMTDQGADVFDTGLGSTPAMFMTTVTEGYLYDGAGDDYGKPSAHESERDQVFYERRRAREESDHGNLRDCRCGEFCRRRNGQGAHH